MDKKDIVEVLERIGAMMEIKGENPFKVRAYLSGARNPPDHGGGLGAIAIQISGTEGYLNTCLR
jgi:DNA polymerase (family 10)